MSTPESPSVPPTLVHEKSYRVWSLAGKGFLTLIPNHGPECGNRSDGAECGKGAECVISADFSGTGKENLSNTENLIVLFWLHFA